MIDVTRMGCQHMSGQTGFPCEGRVTTVTLVRLVRAVGLHMPRQGLFVLELDTTLGTGIALRVVRVMELLMNRQVIFAGECLRTMTAVELVILLMCSLVSS